MTITIQFGLGGSSGAEAYVSEWDRALLRTTSSTPDGAVPGNLAASDTHPGVFVFFVLQWGMPLR